MWFDNKLVVVNLLYKINHCFVFTHITKNSYIIVRYVITVEQWSNVNIYSRCQAAFVLIAVSFLRFPPKYLWLYFRNLDFTDYCRV